MLRSKKVIEAVQRPTLVLAHNKTLAAQLCAEFKEFFPNNAGEYFVSYYDYYQPSGWSPLGVYSDTTSNLGMVLTSSLDLPLRARPSPQPHYVQCGGPGRPAL